MQENFGAYGTEGLSVEGNLVAGTSEARNVFGDPSESQLHVMEAIVSTVYLPKFLS